VPAAIRQFSKEQWFRAKDFVEINLQTPHSAGQTGSVNATLAASIGWASRARTGASPVRGHFASYRAQAIRLRSRHRAANVCADTAAASANPIEAMMTMMKRVAHIFGVPLESLRRAYLWRLR